MEKKINLYDLIYIENQNLSRKYLKYYLDFSNKKQFRFEEIMSIKSLVKTLDLSYFEAEGFYYSYELPHLNKELDLLKVTKKSVINIELKSKMVSVTKAVKQLRQNKYYLNLLKKKIYLFTYCSENNKLYELKNDKFNEVDLDTLKDVLKQNIKPLDINLNDVFSPSNILISPAINPDRFIKNEYLLTDSQLMIKRSIMKLAPNFIVSIIGDAGSGKTMLLYDIAKSLDMKVLILIPDIIKESYIEIMKFLKNITIKNIDESFSFNYDLIIIDEGQRLEYKSIKTIIDNIKSKNLSLIFSYDEKQRITNINDFKLIVNDIKTITNYNYKLSNIIRANKDIVNFLNALFDRTKKLELSDNIVIKYVDKFNLKNEINIATKSGYTYISYDNDNSNYCNSISYSNNTYIHEYDKILMVIDDRFYYDNNKLKSINPNNLIYSRILYQGLSRSRKKICLLVTNIEILKKLF